MKIDLELEKYEVESAVREYVLKQPIAKGYSVKSLKIRADFTAEVVLEVPQRSYDPRD